MKQYLKDALLVLGLALTWVVVVQFIVPEAQATWTGYRARQLVSNEWPALVGEGATLADGTGDVVLVEFGDYQCPACRQAHRTLEPLMDESVGRVLYRHLPLSIHPFAHPAALASICAEEQGAFDRLHRQLFEREDWNSEPDWSAEAEQAGVRDAASFAACMQGEAAQRRLDRDLAFAQRLRLTGTPSFVAATGLLIGVPTTQELADILQVELDP